RRALRRTARAARRAASPRVPGAGLLDHPRYAVGLRGALGARLPLRLEPVRLAPDSSAHPTGACDPVPARAALGPRDLGVSDHGLARARPLGADRWRRVLARPAGSAPPASAAAGRRRERLPCAVLPSVRARPARAAGH